MQVTFLESDFQQFLLACLSSFETGSDRVSRLIVKDQIEQLGLGLEQKSVPSLELEVNCRKFS